MARFRPFGAIVRHLPGVAAFACLLTVPYAAEAQFRGPSGDRDGDSERRRGDDDRSDGDDRRGGDRGGDGGWSGWRGRSGGEDGGGPEGGRSGWSRGEGGDSGRGGFGPPGGFGGGFGPPGGFGGGFGPPGGFGGSGFGPPGGGGFSGRPSPDFFFDRLDRDRDGTLSGEEIETAPGFFRGMIDRAGVREGASKEDFSRDFGKMQEEFQSGRDRGDREGGDRGRDSRSGPKYYVPAKKDPVTIDLPDDYRSRDLDEDGQIGLYEWREWDRGNLEAFYAYDHNGDGFLTPREIKAGPSDGPADGDEGGREVADRGSAAPSRPAPAVSGSDEQVALGKKYFAAVDGDHDGKASPEELGKLRKLRPGFEKAGVRLDQEMTQDQFVANYLKSIQE